MTVRGCAPDRATYFSGSGERDIVHIRMFDQRLAGRTIAGHDVHHAGGQPDFLADLGKRKRGERRELSRLQDDGISRCQRRRDLPGQHEQWEIPGNDLSHDPASRVVRKLLLQKLRPTSVVIKMPGDERNIEVSTLANRLSIVHRFQNSEPARMLLYLS